MLNWFGCTRDLGVHFRVAAVFNYKSSNFLFVGSAHREESTHWCWVLGIKLWLELDPMCE